MDTAEKNMLLQKVSIQVQGDEQIEHSEDDVNLLIKSI